MKTSVVGLFLVVLTAIQAYPQLRAKPDVAIVYDPLFWKKDLRLSDTQCAHIRNINARFYESLNDVASASLAVSQKRRQCFTLLQQRSDAIWEIFSRKQKNEWRKLELDKNEIDDNASTSTSWQSMPLSKFFFEARFAVFQQIFMIASSYDR